MLLLKQGRGEGRKREVFFNDSHGHRPKIAQEYWTAHGPCGGKWYWQGDLSKVSDSKHKNAGVLGVGFLNEKIGSLKVDVLKAIHKHQPFAQQT